MVVTINTDVDPGLEAIHPRHMSVALRALRNLAGAGSSASFNGHGGEQILGIIPADLESHDLSSEPKPLPTKFSTSTRLLLINATAKSIALDPP